MSSQLLWILVLVPLYPLREVSQTVNARPWCCSGAGGGCQSWDLAWGQGLSWGDMCSTGPLERKGWGWTNRGHGAAREGNLT